MIQSDWYYTLCAGGRIASSFLRCWSIAGHCGRRTRPWPTLLTTPASFTTGSPQAPRIICSITSKHDLQMSIIIKYIIGSLVSLFLKKTVLVNKLVLQKNKFWRIYIFFKSGVILSGSLSQTPTFIFIAKWPLATGYTEFIFWITWCFAAFFFRAFLCYFCLILLHSSFTSLKIRRCNQSKV